LNSGQNHVSDSACVHVTNGAIELKESRTAQKNWGSASMTYSLSRAFIKSLWWVIFAKKTSKTGNMMKIELDWCHLQAGTGDHLRKLALKLIIETCWIMFYS
jgi:hypothetical protein